MFFNPDDDDDGFTPSKSSKLASLFGSDKDIAKQSSLMYTAPKQPKRPSTAPTAGEVKTEAKSSAGSSVVIYAGVVVAYKFDESQPVHQGKLGAAVIGNHELCIYSLLLYRGKQQKVASATITLKFAYTVQDNNYASFYDDHRKSWSINFESEQNATDFAKQVALAKANSAGQSLNSVLIQDLCLGHGACLEPGDVVYVKFTGWILANHTFGHIFDGNEASSDYLKLRIGDGKTIKGIETGIVGMKRGGQRFLIIPPSMGYGAQGKDSKVPDNATLIFAVQAKGGDGASSHSSTPISAESGSNQSTRPTIPTKSPSLSPSEDTSVKARTASISEQLNLSPKSDKAKIISRMAKMGQQMLPLQGAVPVQPTSSESETEEEQRFTSTSQRSLSPESLPKPLPRSQPHLKLTHPTVPSSLSYDSSTIPPMSTGGFPQPHGGIMSGQALSVFQPVHPLGYPMSSQAHILPSGNPYVMLSGQSPVNSIAGLDAHVPILLSEVRAQNTELRLNVTQVAEKVDRVLGKLEQSSVYPTMEAGMLAHNIQRIIQENESLKNEVKEKNQKIVTLTEKITELLQRNQKCLEHSNTMLEQRSDFLQSASAQTQARLASLEQERIQHLDELSEAKTKILDLHTQLKTVCAKEQELESCRTVSDKAESENEILSSKCESLEMSLNSVKQELASTVDKLYSELQENSRLKQSLKTLENECGALRNKPVGLDERNMKELAVWKSKCDELEKQLAELKLQAENVESNVPNAGNLNLVEEMKKIMNATYRSLQRQFQLEENYTGEQIKGILASTIRSVTLQMLDHFAATETAQTQSTPATAEQCTANIAETDITATTVEQSEANIAETDISAKDADPKVSSDFNEGQGDHGTSIADADNEKTESTAMESGENGAAFKDNDNKSMEWKPQPPPLFDVEDESDTEDDWLK